MTYVPAFPKPKDKPKVERGPFRTKPDGREICGTHGQYRCREGVAEYKRRIALMAERQGQRCCLEGICPSCPGSLLGWIPTFEHERGRGAGNRDDRTEINGRWFNGAAHLLCNGWKGSRKIDYNAKHNAGRKNVKRDND